MKIVLTSLLVDDQEKALKFYTEVLGFVKKRDIPIGESRWLTVVSPEGPEGIEMVLEPTSFPPSASYQFSLLSGGTPAMAFASDDIQAEYSRLKGLGVAFRGEPESRGPIVSVLFEDTCGNLINLFQAGSSPI
jgi:catechol 2,3-dioxygenase-like lactoylglutathione lyase family enzyme